MTTHLPKHHVDYLIVGQGLAGSLLAWELLRLGKQVCVIDSSMHRASDLAGLFNPLAGKGHKVAWQADTLFALLQTYYPALEQALQASFYHPIPLVKPFLSAVAQARWQVRVPTPYATYHGQLPAPHLTLRHGGLVVSPAGYVVVTALLHAMEAYLHMQGALVRAPFRYTALEWLPAGIAYQGLGAGKVIFCEGVGVCYNPFFQALPWSFIKGERLCLRLPCTLPYSYSQGVYLYAHGKEAFLGGTYTPFQPGDSLVPTLAGEAWLRERLARYLHLPYEVVGAQVAVRVTTHHQRPLVGAHPSYPHCYLFNGLGSKGVSLAPYLATCLATHLVQGTFLPAPLVGPPAAPLLAGGASLPLST